MPQTTSLLSTIVGAYDELNDVETSSKAQSWAPPPAPQKMVMSPALTPVSTGIFRGGLQFPILKILASKVKIQERKGKILREKRVEYHAFISYGPLTKRHRQQIRPCV